MKVATRLPIDLEASYEVNKAAVIEAFQRIYLSALLQACAGNVAEVARRSGLDYTHIHKLCRVLHIDKHKRRKADAIG